MNVALVRIPCDHVLILPGDAVRSRQVGDRISDIRPLSAFHHTDDEAIISVFVNGWTIVAVGNCTTNNDEEVILTHLGLKDDDEFDEFRLTLLTDEEGGDRDE